MPTGLLMLKRYSCTTTFTSRRWGPLGVVLSVRPSWPSAASTGRSDGPRALMAVVPSLVAKSSFHG
jgi:hypothetical protein